MVRALVTLSLLVHALPAQAQSSGPPVVRVEHVRGPIGVRELRGAWTGRTFRRCLGQAAVVSVPVRVELDGSVRVEDEVTDDSASPQRTCVFEVLANARFSPQTEPTFARVTVDFSPSGFQPRSAALSAGWPGSGSLAARPRP